MTVRGTAMEDRVLLGGQNMGNRWVRPEDCSQEP